jgi:hypothetical protein
MLYDTYPENIMRTMYWRSTLLAVLLVLICLAVLRGPRIAAVPATTVYSAVPAASN